VFPLNFVSAGKGPFIARKAKNMHQRSTFLGIGGSGVRDMALPLLAYLGAKFIFLILRPILRKSAIVTFTQQFKTIADYNNFTLSSILKLCLL